MVGVLEGLALHHFLLKLFISIPKRFPIQQVKQKKTQKTSKIKISQKNGKNIFNLRDGKYKTKFFSHIIYIYIYIYILI